MPAEIVGEPDRRRLLPTALRNRRTRPRKSGHQQARDQPPILHVYRYSDNATGFRVPEIYTVWQEFAPSCQYNGLDIALFGGTFDPIHNAHLAVARAARDRFRVHVLVIPAAVPPHKRRQAESWEHRFRMVQLACEGEPGLEPSALESGAVKSYSIDTIERVRRQLGPDVRLLFVIGADAFAEIETWHRWKEVVRAVEFIVVNRPGHRYSTPEGARVHELTSVDLPVSSSEIREKLMRCEAPAELPDRVFAYIREHRLYGYGSACAEHPAG